jgi:hypothetical protein
MYPFATVVRPCAEVLNPEGRHHMSSNESTLDRIIRVIVAVVAVAAAFAVGPSSVLGIILFVVAAIMLVTAAVGFCPLYRLVGLSTKKKVTV